MIEIRGKFEKLKEEGKNLEREIRERTVGYIIGALGLVVGLAWNDAIKALIESLFPLGQETLAAKFIYAGVITIALVGAIILLLRSSGKPGEK